VDLIIDIMCSSLTFQIQFSLVSIWVNQYETEKVNDAKKLCVIDQQGLR